VTVAAPDRRNEQDRRAPSTESLRRVAPDWTALAPIWECFEQTGSTYVTVRGVLSDLQPPVLYVGGGRGTFAARLARWLGPGSVIILDSCEAMARRTVNEFGEPCVVADARAIPLADGAAASAYCATGVLDYLPLADRVRVLAELGRAVSPGGLIAVADRVPPTDPAALRRSLAAWRDSAVPDRWRDNALPERGSTPFDAVARLLGDRTAAYDLLLAALPTDAPAPWVDVAELAAEAGLVVDVPSSAGPPRLGGPAVATRLSRPSQPTVSANRLDLRRLDRNRFDRVPVPALDPPPGDEADRAEDAVHDVHQSRRVVARRQQ
jgi:SAM-dependent methyltransferase